VQQPVDYFSLTPPTGGVVYAGDMVPSTPIYVSTPVYTYAVPISYGETLISPPSTALSPCHTPSSTPVVKTEARKIIITQLPLSTSAAELKEYLIKTISKSHPEGKLSSSASYQMIQELDLAAHSDGKPKGHAFAVFETHQIAKRVINAVDGHRYNGKTLNARFAKEGAEPAKRHLSKGSADIHLISPSSDRHQPPATTSLSSNRSPGRSSKSSKDKKNRDDRRLAPTEIRDHEVGNSLHSIVG